MWNHSLEIELLTIVDNSRASSMWRKSSLLMFELTVLDGLLTISSQFVQRMSVEKSDSK